MFRGSRTARKGDQRGAVAVEAALVLPILVLILFGIIEYSLVFRDSLSITSATRQGARVASAAADAGPGVCETGPTAPPCAPAGTPALAQAAADAIQRAGSAMPKDTIDYILVYKANNKGFPGAAGNTTMPTSCAGYASCVMFVWRPSADAFRYQSGTWDSRTINACVNESDTLGVYMHATHDMVSGFFGQTKTLQDRAVMKFEPLPEDSCKSTRPVPHP
ncbi:MAG: TadE/TadG family type IV pilus assembly protein [Nocardioides sp.]